MKNESLTLVFGIRVNCNLSDKLILYCVFVPEEVAGAQSHINACFS